MRAGWCVLGVLALAACRERSGAEPTGASSAVPPGRALAVPADQMRGCPVTAPGARTSILEEAGAVRLIVRAGSEADVAEIRKRGRHLLEMVRQAADPKATGDAAAKRAALAEAGASGKQGTAGLSGKCPVMWRDAALGVEDVPQGAAFTLRPADPKDAAWLGRQVRERFDELAAGED
jgi:hypothetical protein